MKSLMMDHAVAVPPSVDEIDPAGWAAGFDEMFAQVVAPFFFRREPRLRARAYLLGLASGLERKNGWSLAELAGDACPDGMQRLLNSARWDAGAVRDALGRYVAAHLGGLGGVLVADDTGFEKSGTRSAGVQRQYTGTAGKITNCQIGVFLAYVVPGGARALIDRELYMPRSWTSDTGRMTAAGVPPQTRFATKPQLAQAMIGRAAAAGIRFSWVTADEAYGDNGPLRPVSDAGTGSQRSEDLGLRGRCACAGRCAVPPGDVSVGADEDRARRGDAVAAGPFGASDHMAFGGW